MFDFLPSTPDSWTTHNSIVNIEDNTIQSIVIKPKGSAMAYLYDKHITMSSNLTFVGKCDPVESTMQPRILGYLRCMYAKVTDSVSEELMPNNGLVVSLPVNASNRIYTEQEQLKTTDLTFEIVNKSSVEITIYNPALIGADIKNIVYTDDNGLIESNTITYTIECGHTLTNGTFYFNRSYVDMPYYTTPQDPSAVIEPIRNASNKYIGGKVISASSTSTLVVCYCALGGA